jgi:hypothetical protein
MNWTNLKDAIDSIIGILQNNVIPLLFALATIYFLWGVLSYIMSADDEKGIAEARSYIIYGLVGLFVIVSMWGLVGLVTRTLHTGGVGIPKGPQDI